MSSSTEVAPFAASRPCGADRNRSSLAFLTAAILLAAALAIQLSSPTVTDVSWLITLCEKTLDGQKPYIEFIESNPPAAIFIYMPGVALARLTGAAPEITVVLVGFCVLAISLALSGLILVRAGHAARLGPAGLVIAVAVLAMLPSRVFDQREHLGLIAGLPLLAAMVARASGARIAPILLMLAGLGGGIMAAIKPYFALMILAPLPYVVWRAGLRKAVASLELIAAVVVGVLYVAIVALFFPAYLETVAPIVMAVYTPVRESLVAMLGGEGFICWLLPAIYLFVGARDRLREPVVAVPALASAGAILAFLIQGKEWPYQSYPAVALIALSLGFAMIEGAHIVSRVILGALVFFFFVAAPHLWPSSLGYLSHVAVAICVLFIAARTLVERTPQSRAAIAWLSYPAIAVTLAFAFTWFSHQNGSPPLQAAAMRIAPHPKIVEISQDLGVGHPFTRQVDGVWAQRVPSLWITSGARALLKNNKDPSARAKLESYLRLDRDMLIEDIRSNRPDIILISNRFGEFHDWAFADPLIAAELANYSLYARDGELNNETFLYARKDRIANEAKGDADMAQRADRKP
jgi:hypothetical protein